MRFAFNEDQEQFREMARRFLQKHASPEHVRTIMETDSGYDDEAWARICAELGWPAMLVPEAHDGLGFGFVDFVAVFEETGRALLCAPLLSSSVFGSLLVDTLGNEEDKARWLPEFATGERRGTLAFVENSGVWGSDGIGLHAEPCDGGYRLGGTKRHVLDGHGTDVLFVVARLPQSAGPEGILVLAVDPAADGVTVTPRPTLDQTRRVADVSLDGVVVPASDVLGRSTNAWPQLEAVLDRARIALAAEQVGAAEACLHMSVEYAKVRSQFGRPIGSFQAVQHKAADMFTAVETARSAAYYAAWCVDAAPDEVPEAAALAQAYCTDAFFQCAGENIQIHGGIGFTWEHDAHLYFKRAQSSRNLLGSSSFHRARLFELADLGSPSA